MRYIQQNQIVICVGETGSGKTTQIPQYCADSGLLQGKRIAVTQPRRVAAITVAERVVEERKGTVAGEVGYRVRFDDSTSESTTIVFMTDGILVRECLHDALLSKYAIVMLDEAHERSINTDILFGLVKTACQNRSDLKVIITSATLDVAKYSGYFRNCPIVHVPGRLFPVDLYHSKTRQVMTISGPATKSYVQAAVDTVIKIHESDVIIIYMYIVLEEYSLIMCY
jgi:HrpA-like RNA helicase